jgi:hypothetical protein
LVESLGLLFFPGRSCPLAMIGLLSISVF